MQTVLFPRQAQAPPSVSGGGGSAGNAFVIVQIIHDTFEVMSVPAWVSRLLIVLLAPAIQLGDDGLTDRRAAMVAEQIASRGIHDRRILMAMETVPRHRFIPPNGQKIAYSDRPVAIGYGQTISQPYIVAYMCQLARLGPESRVLEVGTGSGYHAAVMAQIADTVYTLEIIPELATRSRETLTSLGYANLVTRHADGYNGWLEAAPFDAIVVTAAADHIPPPLIKQLADGGRMVIPVGHPFLTQHLVLVEKQDGRISSRQLIPVRFVPLTGRN